jgi:hypothetical protein
MHVFCVSGDEPALLVPRKKGYVRSLGDRATSLNEGHRFFSYTSEQEARCESDSLS